jgi:crossover junction endodeoxyribonuclease RuvC
MGSGPLDQRLGMIFRAVSAAVTDYQPDVVSIEQVFMANNAKSALVLGHARGSAICAAVMASLSVAEYSARQIKQSVVGTGSATKPQVQHMVRVLLGLQSNPPSDAADALACAICHVNTSRVSQRIVSQGRLQ